MMEVLLTAKEAALLLNKSERTLRQDRHEMRGLPYVKLDTGAVKYLYSDVLAELQRCQPKREKSHEKR